MMLRWLVSEAFRSASRKGLHSAFENAVRGASAPEQAEVPSEERISPCEVAVVFGSQVEAGGLIDRLTDVRSARCANFVEHTGFLGGKGIVIGISGVGSRAATQATEDLITMYRPSWVLAAGFATSLCEEVRRGHFVMPQTVVDSDGRVLSVGFQLAAQSTEPMQGVHCQRLLSVDGLIDSTESKRRLADQHEAVAGDMETAAIAACCQRLQTRFLAARIVTDGFDECLPDGLDTLARQKSLSGKLGVAAGAMFNRPGSIKNLWKLKQDAFQAADRLSGFLAGVIAQLS